MEKNAVYLRVSTKKQASSGLGLEAQRSTIAARGIIGEEFLEAESGAKSDRPILEKAIKHVQSTGGTLYIAKLDRLARDVEFTFKLKRIMERGGCRFEALDLPDFNTLTLGIFASFAQFERERISQRWKESRAEIVKRRGEWATGDVKRFGEQKGSEANRLKAMERKRYVIDYVSELRAKGLKLKAIAEQLTSRGWETPSQLAEGRKGRKGTVWTKAQVSRLLASSSGVLEAIK